MRESLQRHRGIVADAGARSQGAMAGSAIAAMRASAVMNIPYVDDFVGWATP